MPTQQWEFDRVSSDAEREALGVLQSRTFGFDTELVGPYHELAGHDNLRVLRRSGSGSAVDRLVGGLAILPMGQYFGGRSVSSGGIALVAIDAAARGLGAGAALMKGVVQDMREMGLAVSALYASTQTLYRGAGYERAGCSYRCEQRLKDIRVAASPLTIRAFEDSDMAAVARLYSQRARRHNGFVDRSAFFWSRIRKGRGEHSAGFVAENEDGTIEGYVFLAQVRDASEPHMDFTIGCSDLVASSAEGARRLLTFLSNYGSIAPQVRWWGHPTDAMLVALGEHGATVKLADVWMLRMLDVEAALVSRGYWPHVEASIVLSVHGDEALGESNNARFDVTIENGSAQVTRLSDEPRHSGDDVRVHIRGLAALYTGHLSAWQLRTAGMLETDDEAVLETLGSIFGGYDPWMTDRF